MCRGRQLLPQKFEMVVFVKGMWLFRFFRHYFEVIECWITRACCAVIIRDGGPRYLISRARPVYSRACVLSSSPILVEWFELGC